jgi:hypothetical protein
VPGFGVISEVSQTLQGVLGAALGAIGAQAELHDLQGVISTAPARLTIFLFEAGEDPSARNRPRARVLDPVNPLDISIAKPPMALLLRYLLTPWSGDRATDHKILGVTMRALYDNAIVSGAQLVPSLAAENQAIKFSLSPLSIEERARVWYAVQRPYRLSVSYEARVVNLDSTASDLVRPVSRRTLDSAVPA